MPSARVREWKNEHFAMTPAAGAQTVREIATGLTVKGATLQRLLIELEFSPVTVNVDAVLFFAVWNGPAGGEPSNIDLADNASHLYWSAYTLNLSTTVGTGSTERLFRKSIDVRGQRVFRSDFDGLWVITRAAAPSALVARLAVRTLVLLP